MNEHAREQQEAAIAHMKRVWDEHEAYLRRSKRWQTVLNLAMIALILTVTIPFAFVGGAMIDLFLAEVFK